MSDWTKARDEAKAQAARALFSALLGWFRRKLARKAPAVESYCYTVPPGTEFKVVGAKGKAPRG